MPTTSFAAQDSNYAERIHASFSRQGIMNHLGARLTAVSPGRCEITLPFSDQLTQQQGFFHAGVTSTIADSAGGYAAYTLMPGDSNVLTVEYKLNLLTPAAGDRIVARAQVIRAGRNLTTTGVEVYVHKDGEEKHCATMLQTLMCIHRRADGTEAKR